MIYIIHQSVGLEDGGLGGEEFLILVQNMVIACDARIRLFAGISALPTRDTAGNGPIRVLGPYLN